MKPKTITALKNIRVKLTPEEFVDRATMLAKALADRDAAEADMASMRSAFKSRIDEASAQVAKYQQVIAEGSEWRDVRCTETHHYDLGLVTITVDETGEIIITRPMRDDEKQMEMGYEH